MALAVGLGLATPAGAQANPLTVLQQELDAENVANASLAITFWAPDAVFNDHGPCNPCVGTAAILKNIQSGIADHNHVALSNTAVNGDTVTGRFEAKFSSLPPGVSRIVGTFTAKVVGAKIASIDAPPDTSDTQTAAFLKAASQPPSPVRVSRTGAHTDTEIGLAGLALILGGALLLAGQPLRRS